MLESAATNRRDNGNEGALLFGDLTQEGMTFLCIPLLMRLSHTIFWASTDPAQSLVVGLVKGHDVDLQVRSLSLCLTKNVHEKNKVYFQLTGWQRFKNTNSAAQVGLERQGLLHKKGIM